jgi:hypothetical protein
MKKPVHVGFNLAYPPRSGSSLRMNQVQLCPLCKILGLFLIEAPPSGFQCQWGESGASKDVRQRETMEMTERGYNGQYKGRSE